MSTSPQPSTDEGSTSVQLQSKLLSLHLDYGSNGNLFKLYTLEVLSSNLELLYTWILAPMGTSSSYTHLKFHAQILNFFTLGFWLPWALHNTFKLYTLDAFLLKHNETPSQALKIFQSQLKLLINTKMHSTICTCNESTHNLSLRIDSQEK